mmetsp:Transcript_68358/g.184673  ORF Transcript_68358/g.184673 Transcript_68358/m.184673 type:complete len:211 (+) Transcript_68358:506-1138(+)
MYFSRIWSKSCNAMSTSLLLMHASINAGYADSLDSSPSRRASSMTRLASTTCASTSVASPLAVVAFAPAEPRPAYRGALGCFSGDWGWGSAAWVAGEGSHGLAWALSRNLVVPLASAGCVGAGLASRALGAGLLASLASAWPIFFAGAALASPAPAFLRCAFTEPARKAAADSVTRMIVLCCCASESWRRQDMSRSPKTHTATNTPTINA